MFDSNLAWLVLFGLSLMEGAMLLRFMPSELLVPSAIFFIGSSVQTVVLIVAIAVVGTTIGQAVLFAVARRGGREYVLERKWIPLSSSRLDRFDGWFGRWGGIIVPVSNSSLFVRGVFTIPAGLSEMEGRRFVVLSAMGSLSFQTILAGLYLLAGHTLLA